MSNYSADEANCRASLFKPSGKWYSDLAINMSTVYNESNIFEAVMSAYGHPLEKDWKLVVLDPYHKNSHPVMLIGS